MEFQRGLEINGLAIYLEHSLSCHVLDPVLVLAEEDLGMLFHYAGMFKTEMTPGAFTNCNREILEGAESRTILDAQWDFGALHRNLYGPFLYR